MVGAISSGLLDVAVTVKLCDSPPPAEIPVSSIVCCAASSRMASGSAIASSVGASLTASTVTVTVALNGVAPRGSLVLFFAV